MEGLYMNINKQLQEIISHINNTLKFLNKNQEYMSEQENSDLKKLGRNNTAAIVVSEIITDYYTCIETLFFRISQFFENNLEKEKWHKSLLEKMTLEIKDTRNRVISDKTYKLLIELINFRHFKRYYFDHEYDWDKLDFLIKKYKEVHLLVKNDLNLFKDFVEKLQ
jgi:hypothetical protein